MTDYRSDSPIQAILAQSDALALSHEQRRNMELLDIDFRREALRLLSERQLLELDAQRAKAESRSGLGFTAESLAAIDAITAKLRQAWLRAEEQARAILSTDQLAKLSPGASKLPDFGSGFGPLISAGLDAQVAEAVAARIKDAKVVEIETAQAIAERLFGWAKSAAIVTGVPLTLLAIVLAILGISNWSDFRNRIAEGKKEIEHQLETARQKAKDFSAQAIALQAQYADLKKQFGDVSTLASDVRGLADKVERLEQIQFEQSSALLPEIKAAVEKQIKEYRAYLQSLGYHLPATNVKVFLDPSLTDNAYYDGERLVVGPKLATMPDVIFRAYTDRIIKETKPEAWDAPSWKVTAIYSGLGDYFTCNYQGDPKFGVKYVTTLRNQLPREMAQRGYLRNLVNKRSFPVGSGTEFPEKHEHHDEGEIWGGAFWDIRTALGCKNSARCETADKIVLASWTALDLKPLETVDLRLAQQIVQNTRQSVGADQADKVRNAFARRGLQP